MDDPREFYTALRGTSSDPVVCLTGGAAQLAVAWARVSTDMQEERGLSLPEQQREIRHFAEREGLQIVAEFQEAASAFQRDEKRVEFHRMLDFVRSRKDISAILVHDFSRFSRDSVKGKALFRELQRSGIKVISVTDPSFDPETASGVWMEAVTFAKNEAYSREIAFHTRKGCRANAQTRDQETGWCYKNGGQPLFGYKAVQLTRGHERKGHPIIKSVWEKDDTLHNGKPMHEWARECLLMAAHGASLDELRDFCNTNGIPGRRKAYWGTSTWNALLDPHILMKFTGREIWNVHRKDGSIKPVDEWTFVENAHPAIISEEEAKAIADVRQASRVKRFDKHNRHRSETAYLLSGGLFKCMRCGDNMVGYRNNFRYYLCASQPNRRGFGCGEGVYVRQEEAETGVIEGFQEMLARLCDPRGLVRMANEELRALWESSNGYDPHAGLKIAEIDRKIANIRQAVINGLDDVEWANTELQRLKAEREEYAQVSELIGEPPVLDSKAALAFLDRFNALLEYNEVKVKRALLRECVDQVRLYPECLDIEADYLLPAPVIKIGSEPVGAGTYRDGQNSGGGI